MARQRNPEGTVNRILDTSLKLFMEKGYEKTSIQDILDALGDLTKGAIYHHFKSKDEILVAAIDRLTKNQEHQMAAIVHEKNLTGMEKLRKLISTSLNDPSQEQLFTTAPNFLENPHTLVLMLKEAVTISAPEYIQPILEEGIADGSIVTDYPAELAEVIMLLANLWVNPLVFAVPQPRLIKKMLFLNHMAERLGLQDLIDEASILRMEGYLALYEQKNQ